MSDLIEEYFADVDAMRLDAYVERHTDDVVIAINDNPPARGKDEIRQMIGGFWEMLGGLRHEFVNRFEDGDTVILESIVHYTRKDGAEVPVQTVTVMQIEDGLVSRLHFYNDPTPIFA